MFAEVNARTSSVAKNPICAGFKAASAVVGIELISIEELSTTVLELFDFQKVSS